MNGVCWYGAGSGSKRAASPSTAIVQATPKKEKVATMPVLPAKPLLAIMPGPSVESFVAATSDAESFASPSFSAQISKRGGFRAMVEDACVQCVFP
eukprot:13683141-Alexandrium_andersonii.AAC.1